MILESISEIIRFTVLVFFSLLFSYTDLTSRKIRNIHLILFMIVTLALMGEIPIQCFFLGIVSGFVLFSIGGWGPGDGKLLMSYSLWGLNPIMLLILGALSGSPLLYYFYKREGEDEDYVAPMAPIISIGAIIMFLAG